MYNGPDKDFSQASRLLWTLPDKIQHTPFCLRLKFFSYDEFHVILSANALPDFQGREIFRQVGSYGYMMKDIVIDVDKWEGDLSAFLHLEFKTSKINQNTIKYGTVYAIIQEVQLTPGSCVSTEDLGPTKDEGIHFLSGAEE